MKCTHCGADNPQADRFCTKCGGSLTSDQNASGAKSASKGAVPANRGKAQIKRKTWFVALCVFLSAVLIADVVLLSVLLTKDTQQNQTAAQTDPLETAGGLYTTAVVSGMSPSSGTVGAELQISGSGLVSEGLEAVMLGEIELTIASVSDDLIEANIPFGAEPGSVTLIYPARTVDAGYFEVLPQQKTLLAEQELAPADVPQTVAADTISVTFPGGVLPSTQTVLIEEIANTHLINLPSSAVASSFSVTAGDIHQFDDIITIEYALPGDLPGAPSFGYFNEETSLWDTLPSEIIDGKLRAYTNHLTDFIIYYWGAAIYSPNGSFKIYYEKNDTFSYPGASSMDDLAQQLGAALEEARADYDEKLPAGYREDFTYFGIADAMDVYLDSGYTMGDYNATTNNILLPTDFKDVDEFEVTAAHELFHAYQDSVWNEIRVIGTMSKSQNFWAVEALAELAAYRLAFPEKNRLRAVSKDTFSFNPYNTFNKVHEYSMSCFLQYLLEKTGSTFEEMWVSIVDSSESKMGTALENFFKTKFVDFSLGIAYIEFWEDVIGDADVPAREEVEQLFQDGRSTFVSAEQHSVEYTYQPPKSPGVEFHFFKPAQFTENSTQRIFNVECIKDDSGASAVTQLSGVKSSSFLNDVRIPGGYPWVYLYKDGVVSDENQLYTFTKGSDDVLIIALEGGVRDKPVSVKISEIIAQCQPGHITNAVAGGEYTFDISFSGIFSYVSAVELDIDYGDGTTETLQRTVENAVLSEQVSHTFDQITSPAVTFSLYNVSQGGRDLISRMAVPLSSGEPVTLAASPNPAPQGTAVDLTTNISGQGYMYEWTYDDWLTETTDTPYTNYNFGEPGSYSAAVTVYDADMNVYGSASTIVTVEAPAATPGTTLAPVEPTPEPTNEPPAETTPEPTAGTSAIDYGPEPVPMASGYDLINISITGRWVNHDDSDDILEFFDNGTGVNYNEYGGVTYFRYVVADFGGSAILVFTNKDLYNSMFFDNDYASYYTYECYWADSPEPRTLLTSDWIGSSAYETKYDEVK